MISERIATEYGPAVVTWDEPVGVRTARGDLLLGHGAGGGIEAPDLLLVRDVAVQLGMRVGRVEQPYRVAGRRAPAPAAQLNGALLAVLHSVSDPSRPLLLGGRSSGARVACRTAAAAGAAAVLAVAFPLQPPRRRSGHQPASRLPELLACGAPALVIQGDRDPFGSAADVRQALDSAPPAAADIKVVTARGADHSLRKGLPIGALTDWLARFLP